MATQLIIGAGEVGRALGEVLGVDVLDVHTEEDDWRAVEILHIAFPWSEPEYESTPSWDGPRWKLVSPGFLSEVQRYTSIHQALIVVVHSTVPVGTCDAQGWIHSPVRGRHPHLAEGIRTFVKNVGGGDYEAVQKVENIFREAGMLTLAMPNARTTELGKLLELAQYGVEVRMQKEAFTLARSADVDPVLAYTTMGRQYNSGWIHLGDERFVKPILDEIPGPLGGHCVAQNTPLLNSEFFFEAVHEISPEGWHTGMGLDLV